MRVEAEDILEEITDDLIVYLKAGNLNINSFIQKLNMNIDNLPQLLKIHFILSDEVLNFVKELPENLRRLKTSTRSVMEVFNGKIKGRINWQDTFTERYKSNYLDRTIFSCDQRDKNFNIKENLVLKELLKIIIGIIKEISNIEKGYNWLSEWRGQDRLFERLEKIYSRNIYINRIDTTGPDITDRMIKDTLKSRNKLYRKSAELLSLYKKISKPLYWENENIKSQIKELLQKTFVRPESEDVLFELYWVFKILKKYDGVKYRIIDGRDNTAASWEDDYYYYCLFHDCEGSRRTGFMVDMSEVSGSNNEYLERVYRSRNMLLELSSKLFAKDKSTAFWHGRPDIILEKRSKETGELVEIIIGEVKNTTNRGYALEGLKELLEYMALIKNKGRYFNNTQMSDNRIKGILCLNDIIVKEGNIGNVEVCCVRR